MLEDIDTKERRAHISYNVMENLDFQIILIDNYYKNPNNMHICFSIKIEKNNDEDSDIDTDLIKINNLLTYLVKEISLQDMEMKSI